MYFTIQRKEKLISFTGYSLLKALIVSSIDPKYENRLFLELGVQYKKTTSCAHQIVLNVKTKNNLVYICTELIVFLY